ncbi:hypothetical protein ACI1US_00875 [Leucobacter sp. BZR 635]
MDPAFTSWSAGSRVTPTGPISVMPYTCWNPALGYAARIVRMVSSPMGAPPASHSRALERSNELHSRPAAFAACSGARYAMAGPKNEVTRSRSIVRRNSIGWYSLSSTAVPPRNIMEMNQLFSGDECQIGIAIRNRSLACSWAVAVQ